MKPKAIFAHMGAAHSYATMSTCQRLQVGCALIKNDTPIAIGYNGTKPGTDNKCEDENNVTIPGVRHAEINALNKLWKSTMSAEGSAAVQTDEPCLDCAIDLFNAGVTEVYFDRDYRFHTGQGFLFEKEIPVYKVDSITRTIYKLVGYNKFTDMVTYVKIHEETNQETTGVTRRVGQDSTTEPIPTSFFSETGFIPFRNETTDLYATKKVPPGDVGHIQATGKTHPGTGSCC